MASDSYKPEFSEEGKRIKDMMFSDGGQFMTLTGADFSKVLTRELQKPIDPAVESKYRYAADLITKQVAALE